MFDFDPEKVNDLPRYLLSESNQTLRVVLRRDYDRLLELYRKAEEALIDSKLNESGERV